jgi:recombination associated protein RdgC
LQAGKYPTRLALTFDDRLSFILTEKGEIKRLEFLDVVKESLEGVENVEEIFDADFALMTGEFVRFLPALIEALGGEK